MPNWPAMSGSLSALTLASKNWPPCSAASFSRIGISALQGAHQSAQKSTTTRRRIDSSMSTWRALARVTSITC
jgi:hypothetical protein